MRAAPGLLITLCLAAALPAQAEPTQEARSAMRACLEAVIDGAPVGDVKGLDVEIHREAAPNACTVRVTSGVPAEVRVAVLQAITERKERFTAARTAWEPGAYASRETFCNAPGGRPLNVVVSTAKPDNAGLILMATAVQAAERDTRCDLDEGVQRPVLQ
jgi:hypothetical protein